MAFCNVKYVTFQCFISCAFHKELHKTLRDNPKCAQMEHKAKLDPKDPGLNVKLSFDINERIIGIENKEIK